MSQLIFFGASVTQGVGDSEGGWVDRLKRELHQQMFAGSVGERDEIFNLGIAGNTSAMLIERMQAEIDARTWHNDPFVFVVSIGTNDSKAVGAPDKFVTLPSKYAQNLQTIVDRLRKLSAKILFVGLPVCDEAKTQPRGTSYFWQERIEEFDKAMTEVAKKNDILKVDIFQSMLNEDWRSMLFSDGLHPNAKGHAFIADRVRAPLNELLSSA